MTGTETATWTVETKTMVRSETVIGGIGTDRAIGNSTVETIGAMTGELNHPPLATEQMLTFLGDAHDRP